MSHTQYASTLVYTSFLSEKKPGHPIPEQSSYRGTCSDEPMTNSSAQSRGPGIRPVDESNFRGRQDYNWFNLITEESQVNCDQSSYVSSYFQTPMEGSAYTPRSCKSSLD